MLCKIICRFIEVFFVLVTLTKVLEDVWAVESEECVSDGELAILAGLEQLGIEVKVDMLQVAQWGKTV